MKIKLYLRNINQDKIDDRRTIKGGLKVEVPPHLKIKLPKDWKVIVPIWKVRFGVTPYKKEGPKYLLRDEREGGMLFDQKTSAVYKLDEEAYHTLIEMEHFKDSGKIAERLNIDKEKVEQLKKKLRELKII